MRSFFLWISVVFLLSKPAVAQRTQHPPAPKPPEQPHQHGQPRPSAWHLMQDGVAFLTFNRQGGPLGETEFKSHNWWMAMASREAGPGRLTLSTMFSLEPATVGARGYSEIFQVGETHRGRALVDRQHPHDFLMQLAAVWKLPLDERTSLALAGAPVGEPALGPVAFMHRRSASENPTAPLGHHSFDSTHIAMGVITAALERGAWFAEASIFRGREPDEDRWDLMDPGALDSWSARVWYRPSDGWTLQVSHGLLNEPEELEAGDIPRTTASISWDARGSDGFTSMTAAYGRNRRHGTSFHAILAEATHGRRGYTWFGRAEALHVETDLLRFGVHPLPHHDGTVHVEPKDMVAALTLGGVRNLSRWQGFDLAAGGDVTLYRVPDALVPTHGSGPVSFHLFVRLRPPAPMGRMWNMVMARGSTH